MKFISTRNSSIQKNLSDGIQCGIAKDGGLFIPEKIPQIKLGEFNSEWSLDYFAEKLLRIYFEGDSLEKHLATICQKVFTFRVPLTEFNSNTFVLELFHGPTSSFKDFGARFLSECMTKLSVDYPVTILVATSGDTGSAVACAFYKKSHTNVIVLYPEGMISKRQEQQITCWDSNIIAFAVDGKFDDCQNLVKSAFKNNWWNERFNLNSANSINIGRLLPQITYYAQSSLKFYERYKKSAGYIIPTGNLGNATAAYFAKLMGFPIREIVLATNANKVLPDYLQTGDYQPRTSIETLANAMDVGNPSNLERLNYLFPAFELFKKNIRAFSVSDKNISDTIIKTYEQKKLIICPHTATAFFVRENLDSEPWIIVATADACKFNTIIEPLIKSQVSISPQLQILLEKPSQTRSVGNSLDDIKEHIPRSWIR